MANYRTRSDKSRAERNAIRCETVAMCLMESSECETDPEYVRDELSTLADDARVEASIAKSALADHCERHTFQLYMEFGERMSEMKRFMFEVRTPMGHYAARAETFLEAAGIVEAETKEHVLSIRRCTE